MDIAKDVSKSECKNRYKVRSEDEIKGYLDNLYIPKTDGKLTIYLTGFSQALKWVLQEDNQ